MIERCFVRVHVGRPASPLVVTLTEIAKKERNKTILRDNKCLDLIPLSGKEY
jgi:hypothetical protein